MTSSALLANLQVFFYWIIQIFFCVISYFSNQAMMSVQQSITEKLTKEFKVLKVVGFINLFTP